MCELQAATRCAGDLRPGEQEKKPGALGKSCPINRVADAAERQGSRFPGSAELPQPGPTGAAVPCAGAALSWGNRPEGPERDGARLLNDAENGERVLQEPGHFLARLVPTHNRRRVNLGNSLVGALLGVGQGLPYLQDRTA